MDPFEDLIRVSALPRVRARPSPLHRGQWIEMRLRYVGYSVSRKKIFLMQKVFFFLPRLSAHHIILDEGGGGGGGEQGEGQEIKV